MTAVRRPSLALPHGQFRTSGTGGAPKVLNFSEADLKARIEAMEASKPPGFKDIKSWFNEVRKDSTAFHKHVEYHRAKGNKFHTPPGASIAATTALWHAQKPEGIVSSAAGLTNYALAKPGYQFKMLIAVGQPLNKHRSKIIRDALGGNLWVSYASTETDTISFAHATDVESCKVRGYYVGKPVPGVEVSIIDDEVCVKTSRLAKGVAVDAQDWYHTGDLGTLVDGAIVLTGRKQ